MLHKDELIDFINNKNDNNNQLNYFNSKSNIIDHIDAQIKSIIETTIQSSHS